MSVTSVISGVSRLLTFLSERSYLNALVVSVTSAISVVSRLLPFLPESSCPNTLGVSVMSAISVVSRLLPFLPERSCLNALVVSVTSAISVVSRLLPFLSERSYLNTHIPNKREAEIYTCRFSIIVCYLLHNRCSKEIVSAVFDEGGDRCGFCTWRVGCKRMVWFNQTLGYYLIISQSNLYFLHSMFNKRRLLANQHSTFRGDVIHYHIHDVLNCVVAIIYMTHCF